MTRFSRSQFLRAAAGAGVAVSVPRNGRAQNPAAMQRDQAHALVLSGGGARGAYEAGIIGALAASNGVADGQPLRPYDFVCGTSIGALNGWMVATGQYTRLRQLWNSIASENIIQIKPQYRKIRDKNSGVATRIAQGISLLSGLRTDVRGICQSEPVIAWIKANVDPKQELLLPFVWTATNLTEQRTEYFYRTARAVPESRKEMLLAALRTTVGPTAAFREVSDEQLHLTLFASAAIPVVFDPVELPAEDGTLHQYVDGGVAANTPIDLARTVARNVQVVLLDPPFETEKYDNAAEIGLGIYGLMQRRLMENDIRAAFLSSIGKERFPDISALVAGSGLKPDQIERLREFLSQAGNMDLSYIRPQQVLPLGVGAFHDGPHIQEAIQLGEDAARTGFTRYTMAEFFSVGA